VPTLEAPAKVAPTPEVPTLEAPAKVAPTVRAPVVKPAAASPTTWPALNKAIAAIPNYRQVVPAWTVTSKYGHYGATDLATGQIFISPAVPASRLFSVVVHEYGHALTSANYGHNWRAADAGLAKYFHVGTVLNREYAADCMARAQGATWLNYTSCTAPGWRAAASVLLAGGRL